MMQANYLTESLLTSVQFPEGMSDEEEREWYLARSIEANKAISDFVQGRIDLDTYLDKIEMAGVNIDEYLISSIDNLEFIEAD